MRGRETVNPTSLPPRQKPWTGSRIFPGFGRRPTALTTGTSSRTWDRKARRCSPGQRHYPLSVKAVHKDDRLAQCLPPGVPRVATHGQQPFKILQMPRELVILYETSTNDAFREIFTDGRPRPEITQPSWTCCGDVPYRNWARFPAQAITWTSKLSKSK